MVVHLRNNTGGLWNILLHLHKNIYCHYELFLHHLTSTATLGQDLLPCPLGHKKNNEVAGTVDYTNLFVLSLHKLHQKMPFTYGNHARKSLQLELSNLNVLSYL